MAKAVNKEKMLTQEEKLSKILIPAEKTEYHIPKNWRWIILGNLVGIKRGASPRPIKSFITSDSDGVNWIKIGDSDSGKYITHIKEKITQEGANKSVFVEKGTLLLSNSMSFGRPYILNVDGCIHDGWLAISPGKAFDKEFLYYALLSSEWYFERVAVGTAVRNLNSDRVAATPIPLPPLAEQHRIVSRIEGLFAKLDEAREKAQAVVDGFEDRKAAILHKAFTGELTAEWRDAHSIDDSTWRMLPIKECIGELSQGWSPKCENHPSSDYKKWAVIKTTSIQEMMFQESENKQLPDNLVPREQHLIRSGDILITRAGPRIRVGICCVVDAPRPKLLLCDKAYRFQTLDNVMNNYFFAYQMASPILKKKLDDMKSGIIESGMNLKQDEFQAIEICCPQIEEQRIVVEKLNDFFERERIIKENTEIVITRIISMKKSILARAFRGELGTNDPSDESAEELLKRIL